MAGKNSRNYDDNTDYDAFSESLRFGTIETTPLFEKDDKSFKLSPGGGAFSIRIKWSSIIWGGIFGLITFLILISLYLWLKPGWVFIVLIVTITFTAVMGGGMLGRWSPMQKSTGEDLITYILFKIRQRLATNGALIGGKRPAQVKLNSMAIAKSSGGKIVDCDVYLGTQPMYSVPQIDPYDFSKNTPFFLDSRGEYKTFNSSLYDDGLGDRS